MLLRTEEVHDVSAAASPVLLTAEIDMEDVKRFGRKIVQLTGFDFRMDWLAAVTALRIDDCILPEGAGRTEGIDGAHGGKTPPVLQGDAVTGGLGGYRVDEEDVTLRIADDPLSEGELFEQAAFFGGCVRQAVCLEGASFIHDPVDQDPAQATSRRGQDRADAVGFQPFGLSHPVDGF